ncbi:hypothetical protein BG004_005618 [Podila humilis]|nr:hypothetical protein BG004_005618 [Podila humilis]
MTYPIATKASSAVLAKAAAGNSADSKFELIYFPLHARAEIPRLMFVYTGAKVEYTAADWPAMKEKTRFGHLPVMFEHTADGTVLEFAESQAIERYLAKKFSLLGANSWEEQLIDELTYSIDSQLNEYTKTMWAPPGESRQEEAEKFYKKFEQWTKFVALRLKENEHKGYFVGDKISWADLKAAVLVDRLEMLKPTGLQVPELPEDLKKIVANVKAQPRVAEWYASEGYQKISGATKGFFKF